MTPSVYPFARKFAQKIGRRKFDETFPVGEKTLPIADAARGLVVWRTTKRGSMRIPRKKSRRLRMEKMKLSPEFRRELMNALKLSGLITACVVALLVFQQKIQSKEEKRLPASISEIQMQASTRAKTTPPTSAE